MTHMEYDKLLTVAIPTYRRAEYLRVCLSHLLPQTSAYRDSVEVIVSNNCSPDDTGDVVAAFIAEGHDVRYVCNEENVGPDANILQCFNLARGKYLLVLGDDDIPLDGTIRTIVEAVSDKDYGCVYLRGYSFRHDHRREFPKKKKGNGALIEYGPKAFIHKTNIMLTFISGNVVNRQLVTTRKDFPWFAHTNLGHLAWILSAITNSRKNLYVNRLCLAIKSENSGGYNFCRVFGVNLESICNYFEGAGVSSRMFTGIRLKVLGDFLPTSILKLRKSAEFDRNESFSQLVGALRRYPLFWLGVAPALFMPSIAAKYWCKVMRLATKVAQALYVAAA